MICARSVATRTLGFLETQGYQKLEATDRLPETFHAATSWAELGKSQPMTRALVSWSGDGRVWRRARSMSLRQDLRFVHLQGKAGGLSQPCSHAIIWSPIGILTDAAFSAVLHLISGCCVDLDRIS